MSPTALLVYALSSHAGRATAQCGKGQSERDCRVGDKAGPTPGAGGENPRARIWGDGATPGRGRQTGTELSLSEPEPLADRSGFQLAVTR